VIGFEKAGKTSLIHRIVEEDGQPKMMANLSGAIRTIPEKQLSFRDNLADIKDREAMYYTDIVFCCYDSTDQASFEYIFENFSKFKERMHCREGVPAVRFVLVATQCDRGVTVSAKGRQFAQQEGIPYIETSAITGMGCEELRDICLTFRKRCLQEAKVVAEVKESMGKEHSCCRLS
jgi:GTPase SAR1 family protein